MSECRDEERSSHRQKAKMAVRNRFQGDLIYFIMTHGVLKYKKIRLLYSTRRA